MRVLILGGNGMLGHQVYEFFRARHEVRVTLRGNLPDYQRFGLFTSENAYGGVDAARFERVAEVVEDFKPEAIINAIGIVKQRPDAEECLPSLEINSLLPHKLAGLCRASKIRLVHVSTDCVFSGRQGGYTEDDPVDAEDVYGKTKFLGELHEPNTITLRSSIIGLEFKGKAGLIEWFLAQKGRVRGFRHVIYSGLTTPEMARVIERVLIRYPELGGVWHVATQSISKYELLSMLAEKLERTDVTIEPDDSVICDRSLDGSRFTKATGYRAPTWDAMLDELADEVRRREDRQ